MNKLGVEKYIEKSTPMFPNLNGFTPTVIEERPMQMASMSAVLLPSGTKGKRTCLKHSRVMIHQPAGGMQGQLSDMEITYQFFKEMQKELYNILSENIAKSYGLVDEVLGKSKVEN